MGNKLWEARRKANKPIAPSAKVTGVRHKTIRKPSPAPERLGVGSNLTKIYSWFGFEHKPSCGCANMETRMNNWGPEGCETNMEVILKHIHSECSKAGIPYIKAVQIRLVRLAIKWEVQRLAKLTVS